MVQISSSPPAFAGEMGRGTRARGGKPADSPPAFAGEILEERGERGKPNCPTQLEPMPTTAPPKWIIEVSPSRPRCASVTSAVAPCLPDSCVLPFISYVLLSCRGPLLERFQHIVWYVEVRKHFLDVVEVVERVDEAEHFRRSCCIHRNRRRW